MSEVLALIAVLAFVGILLLAVVPSHNGYLGFFDKQRIKKAEAALRRPLIRYGDRQPEDGEVVLYTSIGGGIMEYTNYPVAHTSWSPPMDGQTYRAWYLYEPLAQRFQYRLCYDNDRWAPAESIVSGEEVKEVI